MEQNPQTITGDMVVSITYQLSVDGEVVNSADTNDPLEYLHGSGEIIPGLEAAIEGKTVGHKFSITLSPEDAYGEYDEENLEEIDKDSIPDDLEIGAVVEVEDEEGVYLAHVKEIHDDYVLLDFNPPLAGKTLTYNVEILSARMATPEELDHGHVHGDDWEEDEEDWEEDEE